MPHDNPATESPPRRSWSQWLIAVGFPRHFLLGLLAVVLVLGGWFGYRGWQRYQMFQSLKRAESRGELRFSFSGIWDPTDWWMSGLSSNWPDWLLPIDTVDLQEIDVESLSRICWPPEVKYLSVDSKVTDQVLERLPVMLNLEILYLAFNESLTDAGLIHLRSFTRLQTLDLCATGVHGPGLAELKGLKQLQILNLDSCPVTDDSLVSLKTLTALEDLSLARTPVTDALLPILGRLERLQSLDLSVTAVTGSGLIHLRALSSLHELDLYYCPVSDLGLVDLDQLKSLTSLELSSTQVTDHGLHHIGALSTLESLHLSHTAVTDSGLKSLDRLPHLQHLGVAETQVTAEGAASLKSNHPTLQVWGLETDRANDQVPEPREQASRVSPEEIPPAVPPRQTEGSDIEQ